MSALDYIWAEGAVQTINQLPSKLDNLGSIAVENPIIALGLGGGGLLAIGGSPLTGAALMVLGLWQWIGLRGIIAGALGLLLLGGV